MRKKHETGMFLRVGATTEEEAEENTRKQHTLVRPEREKESEHCGMGACVAAS